MRRLSFILVLLSIVLTANALDIRQQNINRIKKSRAFLYSDVTMPTRDEAASQAYEQIQQEIVSWATERSKKKNVGNVSAMEINKLVDTIMVRRAEMYRVVAYVRKAKLVVALQDWKLALDPNLDVDRTDIEEPRDTARIEQPLVENQKMDTLCHPKDSIVANDSIRGLLIKNYLGRKGGVIEQIKKARNFFELKQIMEPLKAKGDIIDYGKYATAEHPEDCYLIVYDPAGNIKALLGKGDQVRTNLKTGKDDSIQNYRGCGAIWFLIEN